MAEEVGSAFVSLLPSARGFSAKVKRELKQALRGVRDNTVDVQAKLDTSSLLRPLPRLNQKVKVDAERAGGPLGRLLGEKAGRSFFRGFIPAVSVGFVGLRGLGSALATNPVTATIGLALGASIAGFLIAGLAAAITTGTGLLAAGGILGIGAFALRGNEGLKAQAKATFEDISATLANAAAPLVGPFTQGLKDIGQLVRDLAPDFRALFQASAPFVGMITRAVSGFLRPAFAGLRDSMPGITAAVRGFTNALPRLGQKVGDFFRTIFQNEKLIERLSGLFVDIAGFAVDVAGQAIEKLTVAFGFFTNSLRLFKLVSGDVMSAAVRFFDGGSGAVQRLREAFDPLWQAVKRVWRAVVQFSEAVTDDELITASQNLVQQIKDAWGPLKTFLTVVWDEAWAFIRRVWDEKVVPWWNNTAKPFLITQVKEFVKGIFRAMAREAVEEVKRIPSRILQGLGNIGSLLFQAGRNVIQGLINGIRSKFGALSSALSSAAGLIKSFFPNSPAEQGPLSGQGDPFRMGQNIATRLSGGMTSKLPAVTSAADQLAGSFGLGGPTAGVAAAGAPRIVIDATGLPDALAEWFRHSVRVFGVDGSVESAYGQ